MRLMRIFGFMFFLSLFLYGCTSIESHIVTFNSNGGSETSSIVTDADSIINRPSEPTREGYLFRGWYFDEDFNQEVPSTFRVIEDLEIHANWEKYTSLTFETNSFLAIDKVITTEQNFTVKLSDLPQLNRDGFTFMGWYTDAQLRSPLNEDLILNENKTIYARWLEHMRLSFVTNFDFIISPIVKFDENPSVNISELPQLSREGYIFEGWYQDSRFNTPVEQVIDLDQHKTIYAKWVEYSAFSDLKDHIISFDKKSTLPSVVYSTEFNDQRYMLFFEEETGKFTIRRTYPLDEIVRPGDLLHLELNFYIVDNDYMKNELVITNISIMYVQSVFQGRLSRWGFGEFYNIKLNDRQITSFDRKADHQLTNLMWFPIERELNVFFNGAINDVLSRIAIDNIQVRERVSIINDLPHKFIGWRNDSRRGELTSFDIAYSYYSNGNLRVSLSYRIQKTFDPSGNNSDSALFWDLIVLDKDFTQVDRISRSTRLKVTEASLNNYSGSMPPDTPIFILFRGDGD